MQSVLSGQLAINTALASPPDLILGASDVNSALAVILRLICHTIGWDFGEAWIPNEDGTLEHSLGCYGEQSSLAEFSRQSQTVKFPLGVGLPGRVWQSQEPEWIENVSEATQPVFLRSQQAAKVGLKAGFGVPILAGNQVLAVLVFFKRSSVLVDRRFTEGVLQDGRCLAKILDSADNQVQDAYLQITQGASFRCIIRRNRKSTNSQKKPPLKRGVGGISYL